LIGRAPGKREDMAIIRRRKSKKQRAVSAVTETAKKVAKVRLAWAGTKTAAKVAVPAVAVGAIAAIAKKRSSGAGPETAAV
jgi:hypothetical protein